MRRLLDPLTARSTWRRWGYLLLGGALLMPYMMAGEVVVGVLRGAGSVADPLAAAQPLLFLAVLPVVLLSGLVLPVRSLELPMTSELLTGGGDLAGEAPGTWRERWRTASWFTLHVAVGGVVSGLSLALPPFAVWLASLAVVGDPAGLLPPGTVASGWSALWTVPAAIGILLGLVYLAAGAGAVLARLAPTFLGPTPADRLAALERRAEDLAERNRLARELHDSVGHALSVVTLQAGAGGRVLDRDPAFARTALEAIEDSARSALDDLDHVLGLLRDDGDRHRGPTPTLADVDALLTRTRAAGLDVDGRIDERVDAIPAVISREAYRIVQEGLTNVLRHAGEVPVTLKVAITGGRLEIEVLNPLGAGRRTGAAGGRGLTGVRERVALLGGAVTAGAEDGRWHLTVHLPL